MDNTAAPLLARPVRSRRGDHRLFLDQISRRPRHLDRRPARRRRQFPLGGTTERQPALNTPDPSYHGAVWTQAVKPLGPIAYIIKARVTLAARSRRGDLALQRLPHPAGHRDAAAAHGAPLRERARGRRLALQAAGGDEGHPSLETERDGRASARTNISRGPRRARRLRARGRARGGPAFHRRAATVLSRGQYRRRSLARDPSRDDHAFAALGRGPARDRRHRTAMSGCRSASSTSTTSWPISIRR